MAIDYDNLINWRISDVHQVYSDRDTILYSLGLGIGSDPHAPNQLRNVYEKNLVPFPSMAVVLATGGSWSREPGTGITYAQVLHAEKHFEIIRPRSEERGVGKDWVSTWRFRGAPKHKKKKKIYE